MCHRLRLSAAVFVGFGAFYTFAGWGLAVAPVLLVIGLLLATASPLLD